MKKNFISLCIALCTTLLFPGSFIQGQIIADHSIVDDYENIPQQYIDSVKKMWLVIAGESHSEAYRSGLLALEQQNSKYAVSVVESGTPESYTTANLRVSRGTWGDVSSSSGWIYGYGEEDWFTSATAVSRTKAGISYCNSHNLTISAFGFGWCWDPGITADNITNYLNTTREYMSYCTANSLSSKVIFTTGPVDGYSGEEAYNNFLRWQKVRDYVDTIPTAILFDYADILCWDDNGIQTTETWNSHTFSNISDNSLEGSGTGHIGMNGALRIAKAMWWMLARIAGWDGTTNPTAANDILTFSIPGEVSSVINAINHTIAINMPLGTNLSNLTPAITVSSGASIDPTSGTARDFTSPVNYTVTAQNGITTQVWAVTVTAVASTATNILAFNIPDQVSSTLDMINHTITINMPNGTDLTNLTPEITVSAEATVNPANGISGNFTSPVNYTVTAQDGTTTQVWVATVTAISTATDITAFNISGQSETSFINTTNHTISVIMPYGTNLTNLIPTITVSSGATIDPTDGVATDFNSPVDYTVTAQDNTTTQVWTATVTASPTVSTATEITAFNISGQIGTSVINTANHTVEITMPYGTNLTSLTPSIIVSSGATINPESADPKDFSSPVTYIVKAEDNLTTQNWVVTVITENISGINEFNKQKTFTVYPNPSANYCNVSINYNTDESYIVKIQDITGKVVYKSEKLQGTNHLSIPLDQLKPGIYYIIRTNEIAIFNSEKLIVH